MKIYLIIPCVSLDFPDYCLKVFFLFLNDFFKNFAEGLCQLRIGSCGQCLDRVSGQAGLGKN